MKNPRHGLAWISGGVVALLLLAMTPAVALGAARITFGVELGYSCVWGHAAPNSAAIATWKDANGDVKARDDQIVTQPSGYWSLCSDEAVVQPGDTIKLKDRKGARTLTVPPLTMFMDRVHDTFRGIGPPNTTGTIYWPAGFDYDYDAEVTTDSAGRWFFAPEEEDVVGGMPGYFEWHTAKGDDFYGRGMTPYVEVTLNRATFRGGVPPWTSHVFKLRYPPTVSLLAKDTVVGDPFGYFSGEFVDSLGTPVAVMPGYRVRSPAASDLDWIVPNVEATASVPTDFVSGRCYSTDITAMWVHIDIYRTGVLRGSADGMLESDGSFSVDFGKRPDIFYDPANIKHGDRVVTSCVYETGDLVDLVLRVP